MRLLVAVRRGWFLLAAGYFEEQQAALSYSCCVQLPAVAERREAARRVAEAARGEIERCVVGDAAWPPTCAPGTGTSRTACGCAAYITAYPWTLWSQVLLAAESLRRSHSNPNAG